MLIDTKQIINLTDLRILLGQKLEEVEAGKIFLVAKKGEIKAIFAPLSFLEEEVQNPDLSQRIFQLQKDINEEIRKKKKVWQAEIIIRDMRKKRLSRLKTYA